MTTPDQYPSSRTVYCLEWLDHGPNNDTPQWLPMAFPNFEDETTDREYALECYQKLAQEDPGRIRIVQVETCAQIIARAGSIVPQATCPMVDPSEPQADVRLTAPQLIALSYLLRQQQRQLDSKDGDPEPLYVALQSESRDLGEQAGLLTIQLHQLMESVQLTHYRLVFGTVNGITAEQQPHLFDEWLQDFPTACIYQMALAEADECFVWQLYLPAADGQPTELQVTSAIRIAAIAGITFDHQDKVWGQEYQQFVALRPDSLVNARTQPNHPIPSAAGSQTIPNEESL